MHIRNHLTDDAILRDWCQYAAGQPAFVGFLLRLLREQQKKSVEQQRKEFEVSPEDFNQLEGMPLPRPNQFTRDAQRIAEVCHLSAPDTFVNAMVLARSLARTLAQTGTESASMPINLSASYQAAHDADEELDQIPEEE